MRTLAKKERWLEKAVQGQSFFPIAVYGVSFVKTGQSVILAEALKKILMDLLE
jgi:hypothetical protein